MTLGEAFVALLRGICVWMIYVLLFMFIWNHVAPMTNGKLVEIEFFQAMWITALIRIAGDFLLGRV